MLTKVIKICLCAIALSTFELRLEAADYEGYLKLLQQYPSLGPLGDYQNGEIQIVTDSVKATEIGKKMGREVGIVAQDRYWIWLNDAVIFPTGKEGVYGRIVNVSSLEGAAAGVAVVPVLPDGRIVLNRNYRHATRSWEYEIPRGIRNKGETSSAAAIREAKEETGLELDGLISLNEMAIDTGCKNTIVPIFLAKVKAEGDAEREESEAIAGIEAFTLEQLKEGYRKGFIVFVEDGKEVQIPLRDPFLAFALLQVSFLMD